MLRLESLRILLVEDNWLVAELVAEALAEEGAQVIGPASTVATARDLCRLHRIDMAVVDLNLEGQMSYSLLHELEAQDIPTVVITAYGYAAHLPGTLAAIVKKPFVAEELVSALQQHAA